MSLPTCTLTSIVLTLDILKVHLMSKIMKTNPCFLYTLKFLAIRNSTGFCFVLFFFSKYEPCQIKTSSNLVLNAESELLEGYP